MGATHRWKSWLLIAALLFSKLACQSSNQVDVHGEVTLDSVPVDPGNIIFYPEAGTESRNVSAAIVDGKYEIPAQRGPSPGKFKVEISWSKRTGKLVPSADPGIMREEIVEKIPARYNTESTLQIEITPGKNRHDFHLQSR